MKKLLLISLLFVCLSAYKANGQIGAAVVTNPVADPLIGTIATAQVVQADIMVMEKIAKYSSNIITSLTSVQRLIKVMNAISCSALDFNFYVELATGQGFWNCWLDDDVNKVINTMMAVVDVVNTIVSTIISSDPADRLMIINDAINRYFELELEMRLKTKYIQSKLRKNVIASYGRRASADFSTFTVKGY